MKWSVYTRTRPAGRMFVTAANELHADFQADSLARDLGDKWRRRLARTHTEVRPGIYALGHAAVLAAKEGE